MHSQSLPNTQIQHNLLGATRDGIGPHIPIQPLDLRPLPTPTIRQAAKDLAGLPGTEFKGDGRLGLQAGNRTAELQHRFGLMHDLALIDQVLEPVIRGLDLAGHVRELEADDGVIDEFLAEGLALVRVLDALLVADAGEADALDDDADALVVEVRHDDLEALVFLAEEVLHGDLDVLEGHVRGPARPDALAVHLPRADALGALDQQGGDAVHPRSARADCRGEVVAPDAVGDPFLLSVDDVVFAVLGELSFAGQVGDVAAGVGLGDGETDALVAVENLGEDTVDEGFFSELHERGAADAEAADEIPDQTAASGSRDLVCDDHLVEEIPLFGAYAPNAMLRHLGGIFMKAHQAGEVAPLAHLFVYRVGNFLGFIPFGDVGFYLRLNPFADLLSKSGVCQVKVGCVVLDFCQQPLSVPEVKATYALIP